MPTLNESQPKQPAGQVRALAIVVVYALFGALWILTSDWILKMLVRDAGQFATVSMFKGWFYVGATSLLLLGLLRRFELRPVSDNAAVAASPSISRKWLTFGAFSFCVLGVATASVCLHWQQQEREEFERLQDLAALKAAQIADWQEKYLHLAESLRGDSYFAELCRAWLIGGDEQAATHLRVWLKQYEQWMGISAALLFDGQGRERWAPPGANVSVAPEQMAPMLRASATGSVRRVGPHLVRGGSAVDLGYVIPVPAGGEPVAYVVMQAEVSRTLEPLLNNRPIAGSGGETLVFRQDGDDVLILGASRFREDAGLKLRQPISSPGSLAGQWLRGAKQPGELLRGVDHRGESSVGLVHPIAGTDWYLLEKADAAGFYANSIKDSAGIALISLLVLAMGGTLLIAQYQHAQLSLEDERHRADRAAQLQANVLANITEGVNVVATDGRILYVNPAFAAMFGYREDELIDRQIAVLNAPTTEHSPEGVAAMITRDLQATGKWSGDVLNRRKDGSIFWTHAIVSGHLMPIWGEVWLSVQHDISERKQAEARLRQHHDLLERFNRIAVGRETAMAAMKRQINALAAELGREPPYPSATHDPMEAESDPQAEDPSARHLAMINLLEDTQAARDRAEAMAASLKESEQRLMMAQEGAHIGIWEWDLRNGSVYWSPEYERLYGVSQGCPHTNEDWRSRVHPDDLRSIDAEWQRHIDRHSPFEVEFRIRRENTGETRWMYSVGSARRDEDGKVIILSGINIDITERKRTEFSLADSEQRYRTLISNLPGVVYRCEVNAPWRMTMISDGVQQLTGHDAVEFLHEDSPLTWGDLVVAEDISTVERAVNLAVASRNAYRMVYRIRHANGEVHWVLEHGRAIYAADGRPAFLDGVITDMSSQKQAEEQLLNRNAELERFNRAALGREIEVIELKKRVNALSQELGREPPYPLAFLTDHETPG